MTLTRRTVVLATGAVLAIAAAAIGGHLGYRAYQRHARFGWDPARRRAMSRLAAHRERFLENQRFAATLPLLAPRAGARDAGPVIGPRVRWSGASPGALERYRASLPAPLRNATLDPELVQRVGAARLDLDPGLWAGIDLSWMGELARLDLWDLDANSPDPHPESPSAATPLLSSSAPEARDLLAWASLRGAKGLHDAAPGPAIRDLEALARLCLSTEQHLVEMIGVAILGIADDVRERAARSGADPADLGVPLGADARRRLTRATWATYAYAQPWTSGEFDADWPTLTVGRCSALKQGLSIDLWLRPLVGHRLLDDGRRLERLLASTPSCRLRRIRAQLAAGADTAAVAPDQRLDETLRYVLLAQGLETDPFSMYDRDPPR